MNPFVPSRSGYFVGISLIAIALIGVPSLVLWIIFSQPSPVTFRAPGPLAFVAEQAGKHTLWYEHDTIFDGVMYSSNALPSGLKFQCIDARSGAKLAVSSDRGASMSTSNVKRESVAFVQIPAPGRYLISVEGATQPSLFSFGPAVLGTILGSIFGSIPVAFALFAGGVALTVRTYIRRRQALRDARTFGF